MITRRGVGEGLDQSTGGPHRVSDFKALRQRPDDALKFRLRPETTAKCLILSRGQRRLLPRSMHRKPRAAGFFFFNGRAGAAFVHRDLEQDGDLVAVSCHTRGERKEVSGLAGRASGAKWFVDREKAGMPRQTTRKGKAGAQKSGRRPTPPAHSPLVGGRSGGDDRRQTQDAGFPDRAGRPVRWARGPRRAGCSATRDGGPRPTSDNFQGGGRTGLSWTDKAPGAGAHSRSRLSERLADFGRANRGIDRRGGWRRKDFRELKFAVGGRLLLVTGVLVL